MVHMAGRHTKARKSVNKTEWFIAIVTALSVLTTAYTLVQVDECMQEGYSASQCFLVTMREV